MASDSRRRLELPLSCANEPEASSRGAAILALEALGLIKVPRRQGPALHVCSTHTLVPQSSPCGSAEIGAPAGGDSRHRLRRGRGHAQTRRFRLEKPISAKKGALVSHRRNFRFLIAQHISPHSGKGSPRRDLLGQLFLFKLVATTLREVHSASRHSWKAVMWYDGELRESATLELDVYDRIGGGDGFAAGLIHRLLTDKPPEHALRLGWTHDALLTT